MKKVVTISSNNNYSKGCLKETKHDAIGFGSVDGFDRVAYFFTTEQDADDFRKLLERSKDY